ncbi:MAG TPA: hypothetical protein VFS23_29075, partial [Vicinamibacterales bacterium]|nr:hypothetical protein [Vicinamibacterales bacterium]
SEWQDRMFPGARPLHLPEYMRRVRRMLGEDQNDETGRVQRADDLSGVKLARTYVAGRDPAAQVLALQRGTNGFGRMAIR